MTDKKIEEYLERAEKIIENRSFEFSDTAILEIAKMIQLEEYREQYPRIKDNKDGSFTLDTGGTGNLNNPNDPNIIN